MQLMHLDAYLMLLLEDEAQKAASLRVEVP